MTNEKWSYTPPADWFWVCGERPIGKHTESFNGPAESFYIMMKYLEKVFELLRQRGWVTNYEIIPYTKKYHNEIIRS